MDILIVEDNKELADLLCGFLRAENYTVSAVQTAEEALLLYEEYGARLVVLDIMLPGRDGFYVLEKIRTESNTPVLIVSAKTEKEDKLNGLNLGADEYVAGFVRRIYDMRLAGTAYGQIAAALNREGITSPRIYWSRINGKDSCQT